MKKILLLVFCLSLESAMAQVIIDPQLPISYRKVFKKMTAEYQRGLSNAEKDPSMTTGWAIFTVYKIDTLNKKEFLKKASNIRVYDIDSDRVTGKRILRESIPINDTKNTYLPTSLYLQLTGEGFNISIGDAIGYTPYIAQRLNGTKLISTYEVNEPRDTIFRLNLTKAKTSKLSIPIKMAVLKLNTSDLNRKIIYGSSEGTTGIYYRDDANFSSGYIKLRVSYKCYFRSPFTNMPFFKALPPL